MTQRCNLGLATPIVVMRIFRGHFVGPMRNADGSSLLNLATTQ